MVLTSKKAVNIDFCNVLFCAFTSLLLTAFTSQCSLDKMLPEFEYLHFCAQFLHAISQGSLGISQHWISELQCVEKPTTPLERT